MPDTTLTRIFIEAYPVEASIGVFDWEKKIKQQLYFDIECQYDATECMQSDKVIGAISYVDVVNMVKAKVAEKHYELLEHLAAVLRDALFATFPLEGLDLRISKPGAVPEARNVGVRISCTRSQH